MSGEIIEYDRNAPRQIINFEEFAMSAAGVLKQVAMIQEVMARVMKQDEHFGTIPGTKKPSLYKAGAEKLSLTFRLRPEYEIRKSDLPNGHREYEVVCTLYHIPTGQSIGQGVGSATTMEGKYRFRTGPVEFTGRMVPKEYWKDRDISLIGGRGFVTKKNDDGQWEIAIQGSPVEHDNPADYFNTVLKMAKKRAHVDAILTATAASDIFTQDTEDMPEVIVPGKTVAKESKPPIKEPQAKGDKKADEKEPAGDVQTKTTYLKNADSREGETNGKKWTAHFITDEDGLKFGTFDGKMLTEAQSAIYRNALAKLTYVQGKKGLELKSIAVEQEAGSDISDGDSGP